MLLAGVVQHLPGRLAAAAAGEGHHLSQQAEVGLVGHQAGRMGGGGGQGEEACVVRLAEVVE